MTPTAWAAAVCCATSPTSCVVRLVTAPSSSATPASASSMWAACASRTGPTSRRCVAGCWGQHNTHAHSACATDSCEAAGLRADRARLRGHVPAMPAMVDAACRGLGCDVGRVLPPRPCVCTCVSLVALVLCCRSLRATGSAATSATSSRPSWVHWCGLRRCHWVRQGRTAGMCCAASSTAQVGDLRGRWHRLHFWLSCLVAGCIPGAEQRLTCQLATACCVAG